MKTFLKPIVILLNTRTITMIAMLALISACQSVPLLAEASNDNSKQADATNKTEIPAIDFSEYKTLDDILPTLASKRVVFVGETHDQYHHHLSQLAVIKGLYAINPNLAIGLEFFQRPFQSVLDAYIAGEINEQTMLEKTEYFDRWQFDYRLYQPILEFARAQKIPLIALNLQHEITRKVGKEGLKSLNEQEASQIPASIDRDMPGYRERIEAVFHQHPSMKERNIENFINVQLLWDEGMAETAANYLQKNKNKNMVILAGSGHINFGSGIPKRLERRINSDAATVVHGDKNEIAKGIADYILFPEQQSLPQKGLIGIMLGPADQGMLVESFTETSKAKTAGMQKNDQIIEVEGKTINRLPDIRLALWNKLPGDKVKVTLLRKNESGSDEKLKLEVELK